MLDALQERLSLLADKPLEAQAQMGVLRSLDAAAAGLSDTRPPNRSRVFGGRGSESEKPRTTPR